jgi:cell division septum initiation protein DivIVA
VPFIAPNEIQTSNLGTAMRGYDRAETDALLEQVKSSYLRVWSEREELRAEVLKLQEQARENDRLRAQLERVEPELQELQKVDQLLRSALVSTERTTEKLKEEARAAAETTVKAARKKADELNTQAEQERERLEQEIAKLEETTKQVRDRCRELLVQALEAIGESEALAKPKPRAQQKKPAIPLGELLPESDPA